MVTDISISQIKKLREQTGAGVMDTKRALEESGGNFEKAKEFLKEQGVGISRKKTERETTQGLVVSYIHNNNRVGGLVEVNCETDFVARTEDFKYLCHELAMQVAAMNPSDVVELLEQEYIREPAKKISDLVLEVIAKTGENIVLKRFVRYELGE